MSCLSRNLHCLPLTKCPDVRKMEWFNFQNGRVDFEKFANERVKTTAKTRNVIWPWILLPVLTNYYYMSRPARKPTLWTLRKVSTRISLSKPLSKPPRLTRTDTFHLLWIFCFRHHYSIPVSPWDGMCRPGLACADCAGWSGSIHYEEVIMLVFSRDGSYMNLGWRFGGLIKTP